MNTRRKKICKIASASSEEKDCISDLPHNLLYYILSFLTTKEVVRTSVLSNNWKNILLGVHNIHIDHNVNSQMARVIKRRISSSKGSPVVDFKLEHEDLPKSSVLISWIKSLLIRHPKNIHIVETPERIRDYVFRPSIYVPRELFQSSNLEILKLCGGRFVISFPEVVSCPNLKVLHLNCFTASNGNESRNLRFNDEAYPILEELDFGLWKTYSERVVLSIFLTNLKKLAFRSIASYKGVGIDIHTPHLEHLNFMDRLMPVDKSQMWMRVVEMNFRNCPSLISAVIGQYMKPHWCMSLLSSINNVKELYLEDFKLDLNDFAGYLLRFPQLKYLSLLNCYGGSARYLLQCTPNLETFIYDFGCVESFLDSGDEVPLCLAKTLREVRLKYLNEDEFDIASFFLEHGAVLESVIIEHPCSTNPCWPHSTLKRLEDTNRPSKKCVIEIHSEEIQH